MPNLGDTARGDRGRGSGRGRRTTLVDTSVGRPRNPLVRTTPVDSPPRNLQPSRNSPSTGASGWACWTTSSSCRACGGTTKSDRRLLLASEGPCAGAAYCVALAKFGSTADAELLSTYLDHYLSRPDLDYDRAVVLGTLLYLDGILGSEYTTRFLAPGGPWDRWLEVRAVEALDPQNCRQAVQQLCAFVDETAEAFASLDCGS
ncbi:MULTISPECIES: DUF6000 family protein [unclassified Streptomyces]|uniref:DUF6000 family protein n=1 Tax=unclassified Streptomyces TaxID=2593676 RepID=UPI0037F4EF10